MHSNSFPITKLPLVFSKLVFYKIKHFHLLTLRTRKIVQRVQYKSMYIKCIHLCDKNVQIFPIQIKIMLLQNNIECESNVFTWLQDGKKS
jgi:hypothetical protein